MSRSGGPVRRWALDVSPLRASPAFRAAFAARLVSLLGIGLLVVAVPVQTYQLTGSSLHVAAVATTTAVAMLAGSLAGGVLADRVERRRLIQLSRSAAGAAFAVLGVNALLEDPSLPVVYVASAVDGLAGGVSGAALMAVVPGLVGRDRLAAAGALIALTTDLGTLAGPALAGLVIAAGGLATTYLAAAAATALTVVLVTAIGPCPVTRTSGQSPVRALAAAVRFAAGEPVVRSVLLVGALTALVSGPVVLLPAYVEEVLHAGPTTLGLLYAAPAAGAVLGSLTSGWTGRVQGGGRLLLAAVAVMALGPALLGLSTGTLWAFLALAGSGLGRVVADVLRFALLQRSTPDDVRGRVSGLWQVQAVTGTAVGSAAAGLLGRWFPPDTALVVHGVGGLVLTVLLVSAVPPLLRPPTPVPAPPDPSSPAPTPPDPTPLQTSTGR